ncbi:unnamed protein product [Strongylus vulgaris]|uniref:Guanylate cyclase domain-containing protein n=1 Tax=Strongylus vulgaris TaxID=40348 RepID=A0A3P7JL68_STRVU|nr:unnamed protein product [Strongylus vulgaris]
MLGGGREVGIALQAAHYNTDRRKHLLFLVCAAAKCYEIDEISNILEKKHIFWRIVVEKFINKNEIGKYLSYSERLAKDLKYWLIGINRQVAERLKLGQSVEPEGFDSVTVFFSDVVKFTILASKCSPFQVVNLLNDLYGNFDAIIEEHSAYKGKGVMETYWVHGRRGEQVRAYQNDKDFEEQEKTAKETNEWNRNTKTQDKGYEELNGSD